MPRGDGTGPMGMGAMTGRAAGYLRRVWRCRDPRILLPGVASGWVSDGTSFFR